MLKHKYTVKRVHVLDNKGLFQHGPADIILEHASEEEVMEILLNHPCLKDEEVEGRVLPVNVWYSLNGEHLGKRCHCKLFVRREDL